MELSKSLVNSIQYAAPKELGRILDEYNKDSFQENDWSSIAVKASYATIISMIEEAYCQCKMYLDYGNVTMEVYDCRTGEQRILDVKQALTNLRLGKEFFNNPPIVEKPIAEAIAADTAVEKSIDTGWYNIKPFQCLERDKWEYPVQKMKEALTELIKTQVK